MISDKAFVDAFCRGCASPPEEASAPLEAALRSCLAAGREAWPTIELEDETFAEWLGERVGAETDVVEALRTIRASDVFLACACVVGAHNAADAFGKKYGHLVDETLRRADTTGNAEDARQIVLERLLLPRGDRPPALSLYGGQGALDAYLRVAVTREVFKMLRKTKRESPRDGELFERMAGDDDPETTALKQRYSEPFKAAFHEALSELAPRQRSMLRYHYVERLTTRQIGVIFGAHSSTVTRQLAQIRALLLSATRNKLMAGMGVHRSELDSIVRLVESQLDLSLTRVLATQAPKDPPS